MTRAIGGLVELHRARSTIWAAGLNADRLLDDDGAICGPMGTFATIRLAQRIKRLGPLWDSWR